MRISEETIQVVREATDLVEIISRYVTLRKRGRSYVGLCPFHHEKTPSFHVDPVRRLYHCFGCGEGGNVFTFLMRMEHLSFQEALIQLAQQAGIPLALDASDGERERETESLYHANRVACDFFRACFLTTRGGEKARRYLVDRGFDEAAAERFQIGYAPNRWDGLFQKVQREGLSPELFEKAGLLVKKTKGGYYDRFRGRLIFPIQNVSGRVIGFGGRALLQDPRVPKYLNSSETPIYQKGRILYGLSHALEGIRREGRILIVEGYFDLLRLFVSGFDYAVATSGTALTSEHARLLSRYGREVLLVFDGDTAGLSATVRALEVLLSEGLHVGIVLLPHGEDPDSLVRQQGPGAFADRIARPLDLVDFLITYTGPGMATPTQRAEAARKILVTLTHVKDPVERNIFMKTAAEKLRVDESVLFQALRRNPGKHDMSPEIPPPDRATALMEAERVLAALLVADPGKWSPLFRKFLSPDLFEDPNLRDLVRLFFDRLIYEGKKEEKGIPEAIVNDPVHAGLVARLRRPLPQEEQEAKRLACDCIRTLLLNPLKRQIREKREAIKERQARGEEVSLLIREWWTLKKTLADEETRFLAEWKKMIEMDS